MLLDETIKVKWNYSNKQYYEERGYIFTEINKEFDCAVDNVSKSSISRCCNGETKMCYSITRQEYLIFKYASDDKTKLISLN